MIEITVKELEGGRAELYIDDSLIETYATDNPYQLAIDLQSDNPAVDVFVYSLEAQEEVNKLLKSMER